MEDIKSIKSVFIYPLLPDRSLSLPSSLSQSDFKLRTYYHHADQIKAQ